MMDIESHTIVYLRDLLVRNFWTLVGVTVRGDPSMRRVCAYLFPGESGVERLAAVDRSIARLPGLEWFDLGARYARRVQASAPRMSFPIDVTAPIDRRCRLPGRASF